MKLKGFLMLSEQDIISWEKEREIQDVFDAFFQDQLQPSTNTYK